MSGKERDEVFSGNVSCSVRMRVSRTQTDPRGAVLLLYLTSDKMILSFGNDTTTASARARLSNSPFVEITYKQHEKIWFEFKAAHFSF